MLTFQWLPINISQDNVNISQDTINREENFNTQDNDNRLDTVQITINADGNVPFYCSIRSFGKVPLCPKKFNSL